MHPELRRDGSTRFVAACFIVMILLGNWWLVLAMLGKPTPGWLVDGFLLLATGVAIGGLGMLVRVLRGFEEEDQP